MAWRRTDDKPLREQMLIKLVTPYGATRGQQVNRLKTANWEKYIILHHDTYLSRMSMFLNNC